MEASTGSSSGPKPCGRRPSPDRRGGPAGTAQVARPQEDTAARYTRLAIPTSRWATRETRRTHAYPPFWSADRLSLSGFSGTQIWVSGVGYLACDLLGFLAGPGP